MRYFLFAACIVLSCSGDKTETTDCEFGLQDTDQDLISDCEESRAGNRNTDNDEWPDWRDLDSDGDFIPDRLEAGDDDLSTPAVDSNGDGIPDYLDPDTDGDGVLDGLASDGDKDDDGIADKEDEDADGDTILNTDERMGDVDNDNIPNWLDLDSDGDGFSDADEAGDADPATPPVDTDDDGVPDFLDTDSDDDGTPDLIERAAGSDPYDPTSNVPDDDFFFVLPYNDPELTGKFDFSTNLGIADIFISVDTTGSFGDEIAQIQSAIQGSIIPGVQAIIPDIGVGVGRFEDFPLDPHGLSGDLPYELISPVTQDLDKIQNAVDALSPASGGLDIPESGMEALYQWSTGYGIPSFGLPPFYNGGAGGVGFRDLALPIFIQITDARSHDSTDYLPRITDAHTEAQTIAALNGIGARVIGIDSLENVGTSDDPRAELERIALATSTFIPPVGGKCSTGVDGQQGPTTTHNGKEVCPLVFDVRPDGSGLGGLIVDAIGQLAALGTLDISTSLVGFEETLDGHVPFAGFDSADFIKAVTPVPPAPDGSIIDGKVFKNVLTGSRVIFEVTAKNDFLPASFSTDQLFQIDIRVLGDRVTLLDVKRVFVVVPRRIIQ